MKNLRWIHVTPSEYARVRQTLGAAAQEDHPALEAAGWHTVYDPARSAWLVPCHPETAEDAFMQIDIASEKAIVKSVDAYLEKRV